MEHAADLMIFAGVVLLFVSLFGAILFLFVGLYRDEKWESNEQPDDLGWNEHVHWVLFVRGLPKGKLGKGLRSALLIGAISLAVGGGLKILAQI